MATTTEKAAALQAAKDKIAATIQGHKDAATARAAAAETARQAALSEENRIKEAQAELVKQGEALKAEIATERKGLAAEARKAAAEKLGILGKALPMVPDVDPRTPDGAKALETWAKENPEFVRSQRGDNTLPPAPLPESNIAKILSGAIKHPFVTAQEVASRLASQVRE